jgi:subtilisin family serine protease
MQNPFWVVLLALALMTAPRSVFRGSGEWPVLAPVGAALADDDRDEGGGRGDDDAGGDRGGAGEAGLRVPDAYYEPSVWPDSSFERDEVLAAGLTSVELSALEREGFVLLQQREGPDGAVSRLRVPRRQTLNSALARLRVLAPAAIADRNHLYSSGACRGAHCAFAGLVGWSAGVCRARAQIGLIDTGLDLAHPALRGQRVEAIALRGAGRLPADRKHGTAVAALLVGAPDSPAPGLLPEASLIAVDAFHAQRGGATRMDAFDLVGALRLLAQRRVGIANLSFAGPPNLLLERAVAEARRQGMLLIASAGNDGPRAGPRYPAAYDGVIAVTAVDAKLGVYRRAGRGDHIAFAAPGVNVWTADAGRTGAGAASAKTGTSFAAPFVTAAAALALARLDGRAGEVPGVLRASARDLGAPGFDPVFGHGLIQAGGLCTPRGD